jgi:hypothetical protein
MLKQNDVLRIISRSSDGNWLQVATPSGDIGWISTAFVDLQTPLDTIPVDDSSVAQAPGEGAASENENTAQPTNTPAPTNTPQPPTATNSPEPTNTATPQPTEVPHMTGTVVVAGANVRIAPIANVQPIINLYQGESVTILGRSSDNVWVLVDTGKSTTETKKQLIGWMKANQLSITANDVASLPIATPNPTPTPLPGYEGYTSPGNTGINYDYVDGGASSIPKPCPAGRPSRLAQCACAIV